MLSEQDKHQFFTMLSQGLMQYLLPSLQQISQQVIQQSVSAAQRSTPNHWTAPVVVQRTADEESPNEFDSQQTTPAQLMAEVADLLIDLNQSIEALKLPPKRRRKD